MTDLKTYASRLTLGVARWSGSAALSRLGTRPFGAIFTLHHVSPSPLANFPPNGHLRVSPEFLAAVIGHLQRRGCDIVDLGEAVRRMERRAPGRFFACFTLDDGYVNNAEHAVPVFRAAGVPYAIFVSPGLADGTVLPWWEAAERIVGRASTVVLPWPGGGSVPSRTIREKRAAFDRISIHLTRDCPEGEVQDTTRRLAAANGGVTFECEARLMDWDRIRAVAADPLATIGAHSMTHPRLARLSDAAAWREISASREAIGEQLGRKPDFFAYPYGSRSACGPREFEMARRAGYKAGFTTRLHALTGRTAGNLHALPRLSLNGYYQNLSYVDVLMSGLPGLWKERAA